LRRESDIKKEKCNQDNEDELMLLEIKKELNL